MSSNEKEQVTLMTANDGVAGEYLIISLEGRMVYENSDKFLQELLQKVMDKQQYVVDIDKLDRIDSTGLGVLITFAKKVYSAGGQVAFVVHKNFLRDIFQIAKFDYIFPVAHSQDEAWQALKNGYQSKMTLSSY